MKLLDAVTGACGKELASAKLIGQRQPGSHLCIPARLSGTAISLPLPQIPQSAYVIATRATVIRPKGSLEIGPESTECPTPDPVPIVEHEADMFAMHILCAGRSSSAPASSCRLVTARGSPEVWTKQKSPR